MKVSLNWVKEFTSVDMPPQELIERIGLQLGAVEEVINLGERYKGATVAKVISSDKHPNADKLSVCMIDTGQPKPVQVVCGAPNVAAGQTVIWLPPGATVPSSVDKDPFVLEARDIRGVTSHGMIASAKELALGDDHSGILVLADANSKDQNPNIKAGDDFAKAFGLDDTVIDIENKMFTHRPDCFGVLGVARELAGIQHQPFKSPVWYVENASLPADGRKNVLKLAVKNDVPELAPRFCAVAVKDVKVGPSPVWLQIRLAAVGVRPINNLVDITNLVMHETGQPLHAYDYDKVADLAEQKAISNKQKVVTIGIRLSKKGESLKLLGGRAIKLDAGSVVITDGKQPIGLGGVMGGADTEVDENTKNIILECANFDMNQTRKTAMRYGLFTDAATRFTKNQSPRQNTAVLAKAVEYIQRLAGGRLASQLIDDKHFRQKDAVVRTDAGFINRRLGTELPPADMKKLLQNVEFEVAQSGEKLSVKAPFWRTDIEITEDVVEEVGRLFGYDKLPVVLPRRDSAPARPDPLLSFKARLRDILRRAGANEVLTYSFIHGALMKKAGQDPKAAYHIRNAVSPDLQYYRLSLTPSLLEKVHPNIKAGYSEFALFEMGKGHNRKMKDDAGLPLEFDMLSLVVAAKSKPSKAGGAPFYQARLLLDYLAAELGVGLAYRPILAEEPYPAAKPFEPGRSAQVWAGKVPLGMAGEYQQTVGRNLKLPDYCAGFEIGIGQLLQATPPHKTYRPLNRYPELEQDFCLHSSVKLSYQVLTDFMAENLSRLSDKAGYHFEIESLDIFQKKGDTTHKQTTWRIILWHPERTLTTAETNKLLDELAAKAKKELKAERV